MTLTLQGNGTLNGLTVLGAPVTTLANTGTAASPSLVFDGDSDTGLFRPGANQLGLSVGGAAFLTVASTGAATFVNYVTSNEGFYVSQTDTPAGNSIFKSWKGSDTYVDIFDNGSAKFANGNFDLASYGALSIKRTDNQPYPLFRWGTTDSYTGGGIYPDGSSTFAGDAKFGTGASDARITIGSHGTAGTNDSVHVRADSENLLFMSGSGGVTKFEQNGTQRLLINDAGNVMIGEGDPSVDLHIKASATGDHTVRIEGTGTSGDTVLNLKGATNDWQIAAPNAGSAYGLAFKQTGGSAALFINSSNNIGIGTSDPEEILHVAAASEAVSNRDGVMFQSTSALAADTGLPLVFTSHIGTQTNYGVASIAGRKENATSGEAGGYLQFATGNAAGAISEKVRILSSGGITFNGDTATANALDDYEEGTWTPANQYLTITNNKTGIYIKIGNKVTVWFDCTYAASPSDSSQTGGLIEGLPFANSTSPVNDISYEIFNSDGSAFSIATFALISNSSSQIQLERPDSGRILVRSEMAGRRLLGCFTYKTA